MNPIAQIDFLAKKFLNNTEYAHFVDLLTAINNRLGASIRKEQNETSNTTEEKKQIKYPHELEIDVILRLFRNSQIGERVELIERKEINLLKKLGVGVDIENLLDNFVEKIGKI